MHWGRSAGAFSAEVHSFAYHDDPIAESYYMESGLVVDSSFPRDLDFSNFTFVAQNVGCANPCGRECVDDEEFGAAELDCMRQVSMSQMINFLGQYGDRAEQPPLTWTLIPDDKIVFSDYHARAEQGLIARRPSIVSFTAHEFTSLVPWPFNNVTEGPWQPPVIAASVDFGVCPALNSTTYRNRLGDDAPVFRFQYAATFPNLNVYEWLGAYHNAETPMIFGTYGLLDHIANTTDFQVELSLSMQDHILAFAKDPYNGPQALGWEPMDTSEPDGGFILRFGGSEGQLTERVSGLEIDGVCLGLGEYDAYPYPSPHF
ncbi:Alpha/Beta hydrolase protein [Stachybotrys elegans]|uniref:Alpha/Beta hydrolase protein n=1 Tax=Stachybotrys elegans TaxID=80388 RepID=A0A8K0SF85_9HYPO|nr:Alpha/Beta hydrolase protein [Stachybotrys elegans]